MGKVTRVITGRKFNVFLWLCPVCNRRAERKDTREAEMLHWHCHPCGWGGSYQQIVLGEMLRQPVNIIKEVDTGNASV